MTNGGGLVAQLTVYIDDKTRDSIEDAAKNAGISVSRWVKERLTHALSNRWPEDYFKLLGSLEQGDLERPDPLDPAEDLARERL